jgi:tRNA(Arg) A34 adenosine deaminase TadA
VASDAPSIDALMRVAIDEARASLREGNGGFGAVVAVGDQVLTRDHDREMTAADPTAHAEIEAIRAAARLRGGRLEGCVLVTTHEPCPMCAGAALWAGIREVSFGVSIAEAIAQGRRRIPIGVEEVYARAGVELTARGGVLGEECRPLYDSAVREEVARLRAATPGDLRGRAHELADRRVRWFDEHRDELTFDAADDLENAYLLLLAKLGVDPREAPIVERTGRRLVFHSRNFCPTLEACRILGLDTRVVCRAMTELPAAALIGRAHPNLRFSRNYDRLRPGHHACEEIISVDG